MACTACGSILNGIYKHAPMTRSQIDSSRNRDREIVILTDANLFGETIPSSLSDLMSVIHADTVVSPTQFTPVFEMTSDVSDNDRRYLVTWEMLYAMRNNFGGMKYLIDGGISNGGAVLGTVGALRSFIGNDGMAKGSLDSGCVTPIGKEGLFSVSLGQNSLVVGDYSTVAGGINNAIGDVSILDVVLSSSIIGSGTNNRIMGDGSSCGIFVGDDNYIHGTVAEGVSSISVIVSGNRNEIFASPRSFIGSGSNNSIMGASDNGVICGGLNNQLSGVARYCLVGGGTSNSVMGNTDNSSIVGGASNVIKEESSDSFIGGGYENQIIAKSISSTIICGHFNEIKASHYSVIGGGQSNYIADGSEFSFVSSGYVNHIRANVIFGSIVGGKENIIAGKSDASHISGSMMSTITDNCVTSSIGSSTNCNMQKYITSSSIFSSAVALMENSFYASMIGTVGSYVGKAVNSVVLGSSNSAIMPSLEGSTKSILRSSIINSMSSYINSLNYVAPDRCSIIGSNSSYIKNNVTSASIQFSVDCVVDTAQYSSIINSHASVLNFTFCSSIANSNNSYIIGTGESWNQYSTIIGSEDSKIINRNRVTVIGCNSLLYNDAFRENVTVLNSLTLYERSMELFNVTPAIGDTLIVDSVTGSAATLRWGKSGGGGSAQYLTKDVSMNSHMQEVNFSAFSDPTITTYFVNLGSYAGTKIKLLSSSAESYVDDGYAIGSVIYIAVICGYSGSVNVGGDVFASYECAVWHGYGSGYKTAIKGCSVFSFIKGKDQYDNSIWMRVGFNAYDG